MNPVKTDNSPHPTSTLIMQLQRMVNRLVRAVPGGYKLVSNTGILFFSYLADRFGAIITSIIITRALGADNIGIYTAAMVAGAFASRLTELGIPSLLQREMASAPEHGESSFSFAITLRLTSLLLLISGLIVFGVLWAHNSVELEAVLITIVFNCAMALLSVFYSAFYAQMKMIYEAMLTIFGRMFYLVAILVLVFVFRAGLPEIMMAYALLGILQLSWAWFLFRRYCFPPKLTSNLAGLRAFLVTALPMGISRLFILSYDRVDTLLVAWFLPIAAVGYYGIAYGIFTSVLMFSNAYYDSTYTVLSNLARTPTSEFPRALKRILGLATLLGISAGGLLKIIGPWLIEILYGRDFRISGVAVSILSLAVPFIFTNNICYGALNAIGKQSTNAVIALIAILLNVGANLVLIPVAGIFGAAIVTVVTEGFILLAGIFYLSVSIRSNEYV